MPNTLVKIQGALDLSRVSGAWTEGAALNPVDVPALVSKAPLDKDRWGGVVGVR